MMMDRATGERRHRCKSLFSLPSSCWPGMCSGARREMRKSVWKTLIPGMAWPRAGVLATSNVANEPPLRAELLSAAQMKQHGGVLAAGHKLASHWVPDRLLSRLAENEQILVEACRLLTEALADELKGSNINVNCIMPGTIDTPQNRAAMPDADFTKWVEPSALADVILFLASDASRAINGAALPVYGKG